MRLKCVFIMLLMVMGSAVYSQDFVIVEPNEGDSIDVPLFFIPKINNEPLILGQKYLVPGLEDSVSINKLKFYLSNIMLQTIDGKWLSARKKYVLIDLEDSSSLKQSITIGNKMKITSVAFNIGIDSAIQMQGARGGDLDPANGMYWTWQSGYINFKLEGTSKSCPARKNKFQFHIGGFQAPYNSLQKVEIPIEHAHSFRILLDLNALMEKENIIEQYEVMSPNDAAMRFAQKLPSIFHYEK